MRLSRTRRSKNFTLRAYTSRRLRIPLRNRPACYTPDIAYSRRELRAYLQLPQAECLLATIRGKPIGFCLTANQDHRGHIITIDVLAPHRRQKVGSRLLEAVELRLAKSGVREISLETATDNDSAIAFWQKHGYRTRGIWKGYYPGGRDAYAMSKSIA